MGHCFAWTMIALKGCLRLLASPLRLLAHIVVNLVRRQLDIVLLKGTKVWFLFSFFDDVLVYLYCIHYLVDCDPFFFFPFLWLCMEYSKRSRFTQWGGLAMTDCMLLFLKLLLLSWCVVLNKLYNAILLIWNNSILASLKHSLYVEIFYSTVICENIYLHGCSS